MIWAVPPCAVRIVLELEVWYSLPVSIPDLCSELFHVGWGRSPGEGVPRGDNRSESSYFWHGTGCQDMARVTWDICGRHGDAARDAGNSYTRNMFDNYAWQDMCSCSSTCLWGGAVHVRHKRPVLDADAAVRLG